MKKQSTLFPEETVPILPELDLKDAQAMANQVKTIVSCHCLKIEVAGSIRRLKDKVHDIDFVVVTKTDLEWQQIGEELKRLKAKPNCAGNSLLKAYLPCEDGLFQVDFYRATSPTFGIHLLVRTGSADHNMWLAGHAISKGMRIKYSQGLLKQDNVIAGETEASVFAALGLPCPEPCDRETVLNKPVWLQKKDHEYNQKLAGSPVSEVKKKVSGVSV